MRLAQQDCVYAVAVQLRIPAQSRRVLTERNYLSRLWNVAPSIGDHPAKRNIGGMPTAEHFKSQIDRVQLALTRLEATQQNSPALGPPGMVGWDSILVPDRD